MASFRAYRIYSEDGKVQARLVQAALDELDPGEVVIKTAFSSVNYKDALAATGAGKIIRRFPCIGGVDGCGTVTSSSDARFKAGDEVICTSFDLGVAHDGGYAEYLRVPAGWVVPLPTGLTLFESMALGTAGFTAGLAVERMEHEGLDPGKGPVIVTGATGGVGSIAVGILAKLGFNVVAATGKTEEKDFLTRLGAKGMISREEANDTSGRPLQKGRWGGVVDTVGGNILATAIKTAKYGGLVAACGNAMSADLAVSVYPFILRGVSLLGVDSVEIPVNTRMRAWQKLAQDWKLDLSGDLITECSLNELSPHIDKILKGGIRGRVVVDLSK